MNIECFFIAWNESETIHLTIKHYQQFCDKITVFDNYSTDNTREIAKSMGCDVQPFGIEGQLNDAEYLKVKNNCWKGSKADWVIVCDADEILQLHPLLEMDNCTIVRTQGFSIYSNYMPKESWAEITTGIMDNNYSKLVCFSPKITDINYIYGCHEARPEGNIKYSSGVSHLLHYKYVGGIDRLLKRHRLYKERLSPINKRWNLGHVYSMDEQEQIDNFNINIENSKPLF